MKIFGSNNNTGNEVLVTKLKRFCNKFRLVGEVILIAVILSSVLVFSCSIPGGKTATGADKSRLIKEAAVFIDLEQPSGELQRISRDQIQQDIEMNLRRAGIKTALQPINFYSSGLPIIYVNVTIAKYETIYAYNADLIFMNPSSQQTSAESGKGGTLGASGLVNEINQIRPKVLDLMNRFIREYLLI